MRETKIIVGYPITSRLSSALNFKMFIFNEQWPTASTTSKIRRFKTALYCPGLDNLKTIQQPSEQKNSSTTSQCTFLHSTRFPILTLRAAFDSSCKDGFSLLQALSHSAIPSGERNLEGKTTILLIQTTTVFKTNRASDPFDEHKAHTTNRNFINLSPK